MTQVATPTTDLDLVHATDEQLDDALQQAYYQHRATHPEHRLPIHLTILAILGEQTKRYSHLINHDDAV